MFFNKNTFFEDFNMEFKVFLILIKFSCRQQRFSICLSMEVDDKTIHKIIKKLVEKMPLPDFSDNKFGGPDSIVQIDETMLNYKFKSHRGRSPQNKTDSLCIIEYKDKTERAFARIIPNKKERTIVPIICIQAANNSIIWTDEHKSYHNLEKYSYYHGTVCHKY